MKRTLLASLLALALAQTLSAAGYTKNVAIVIFNGVELLDVGGPGEVFAAASHHGANGQEVAYNIYTVATTRTPIESQGFLDITADYSIANAPQPDILVLPGGRAQNAIDDPQLMAWAKTSAEHAEHVLTICYGSFIAGKLGLLEGLEATTWYGSVSRLGEEFPNTRAIPGRRFLDNGKVITTAGVSAGIDGALHLVARTLGRYVADRTAEYMEYAWTPQAYSTAKYAQLNPRLDAHGRRLQEVAIAAKAGDNDTVVAITRELIAKDANDRAAWLHLGRAMLTTKRFAEAIKAYAEAAKGTAERATAFYELACAYALSGEKDKAIDAASRAVEAGMRVKTSYQRDPDFASIRDDARFQQLIAKL